MTINAFEEVNEAHKYTNSPQYGFGVSSSTLVVWISLPFIVTTANGSGRPPNNPDFGKPATPSSREGGVSKTGLRVKTVIGGTREADFQVNVRWWPHYIRAGTVAREDSEGAQRGQG